MAFRHGVYKSEVPTSIIAPSQGESGLPVIIGTAPVFMGDPACVNKPVLVYTYEEAVKTFGYSDDWDNYTLCEFIYSQFALFGESPCVLVNVFDPAKHFTDETVSYAVPDNDNSINLGPGVISADSLEVLYDDDGNAIVHSPTSQLTIQHLRKAAPNKVTQAEIIGGVSASTGAYTGLELVNQVFPKFGLIPGLIGCPKWSEKPGVAAIMRAKSDNINGTFTCSAVVDIPSDECATYSSVSEWKNLHNYTAERMIACWPKVALDGKIFHLSTQLIGLMNKTDREHSDVPYKSPGNELLQMDSCVNAAGEEIFLGLDSANYLNSQGVITALNWVGGWRAWGNRTAAYPANTDPKDCFIPVRRMFDFIGNTFITTFWQKTDEPMSPRLVRTIVSTFNMYMNSLVAREMLLGGRIEFREDENAITDLMNGILKFHVFITPPVPAEVIEGILEYDPAYLSVLYEAVN
ncbi:MAG: phage tail sheath family protein [Synergistaceae bacterium]|nr:phage tail sheath family protein [Synergistaceae bacterium]MBQ3653473.1 phage tail sheath family protein [Synergistaceae bacterium]